MVLPVSLRGSIRAANARKRLATKSRRVAAPRGRFPFIETLEDRSLLAGTTPPTVLSTTFSSANNILPANSTSLDVNFSEPVTGGATAANFELRNQGTDGLLGSADDQIIVAAASYANNTATLTFSPIATGAYRLTVHSTLTGASGIALDGDADGVAGGDYVDDFLAGDGLKAWGSNGSGYLGNGGTTQSTTPVTVSGLTDVIAIASGDRHTLALRSDGTVWTWGYNAYGQLGDGTTTTRMSPVQVSGLSDVIAVAAGDSFSLALQSDGTIRAWGRNLYGQLGDGTSTQRLTPVTTNLPAPVVSISAGNSHVLALTSTGVLYAWGYNASGQIGNGTTINTFNANTFTPYSHGSGYAAIAAGGDHSLALTTTGAVRAWGYNNDGQIGDGTTTNRLTEVVVNVATGAETVKAISGGGNHSLALLSDGTVKAWGYNADGELGLGHTTTVLTPIIINGLSGVATIKAADRNSFAILNNGTVRAWGLNTNGQLGDGTAVNRLTPVQVTGMTNVKSVAAGTVFSVGLRGPAGLPAAFAATATIDEDNAGEILLGGYQPQHQALEYKIVASPQHGTLSGTAPNLTYKPADDYNGSDLFTYQVNDGTNDSLVATVSIAVAPINDPPTFDHLGNQSAYDEDLVSHGPSSEQLVTGWAHNVSFGPANEGGTATFTVTNDQNGFFAVQPAISTDGKLTYTPQPNAHGTVNVTVTLDDGGEGTHTSQQQFTIEIKKRHKLHNATDAGSRNGLDVTGSTTAQPDGSIVAGDVLAVINYINANKSGEIPANVPVGAPYVDVDADDQVTATDVITVINWINAHPHQSEAESNSTGSSSAGGSDLFELIATDLASNQSKRRRS